MEARKVHWHRIWVILLILAIIPIVMYSPYYMADQALGDADLVQYFSGKKAFGESLLNGEFQQWNKYLAGGMPQAGITDFYIISTIFSLLPLKQYMYVYFVFHLFIGGLFFFLYLRECQCEYKVAFVMAVLFECSIQINGLRKSHPTIVAAICLFPVIMFLVKKFFNTKQKRWLYLSAFAAGLQATVCLQDAVYADIILVIYLLVLAMKEKYPIGFIFKQAVLWIFFYVGFIAYSILPTLSIMGQYAAFGTSNTSFETFCSYSLHPIKLLQMVYPKIFGNVHQAFGVQYSSEMDIELYLGIFILLLAINAIIAQKKNIYVQVDTICAGIALVYAMVAHIPVLNRFVYQLPVLGGFRCAARILFIFYFFMFSLAAKQLNSIIEEHEFDRSLDFIKKAAALLCGLSIGLILTGIVSVSVLGEEAKQLEYLYKIKDILIGPIIITAGIFVFLKIIQKSTVHKDVINIQWIKRILCVGVLGITLFEVLPYSLVTSNSDLYATFIEDGATSNIKNNIGNDKIWDDFNNVDGAHQSIISQNKSVIKKIPAINAYTAFNNPLMCKYFNNLNTDGNEIPFNYSGLLTGSLNAENNVLFQNDLLSMLGVKYVIDSSGIIEENTGISFDCAKNSKLILSKDKFKIDCAKDSMGVSELTGEIKPDTLYKISFTVNSRKDISHLSVDIYGGEGYDKDEQEYKFALTGNEKEYTAYLYSGNGEGATEDIRMRMLIKSGAKNVDIENCEIFAIDGEKTYEYFDTDDAGNKIYINKNAKSLLYFPKEMTQTETFDDMYRDSKPYDLDNVAYTLTGENRDLSGIEATADIVEYTNNRLVVQTKAKEDTYLCFSQSYAENWKVSVDGKEQDVDMVNGLIMGTSVPKGEHTIVFEYTDKMYVIGNIITAFTWLFMLGYCVREKRKEIRSKE